MDINELLQELNINKEYEKIDNRTYSITIDNSNEFGKIFTKLDNSNIIESLEDSQLVTNEGTSLIYENEEYLLTLQANFENDIYNLIITDEEK